ncbi:predicted protein [Histoplasma capsulatum G186AR]|uniref:Uncharacterized protein n=2 Tax=Ajellomyces capsulatus TaxID=5037 RepID=C0NY92_AJECG|nr:uncharacterized protein HCBG_07886 [Histoplasma capsulatum G186AR]EEH03760.1 predicted protein [Histoplasma capsulatum G186AR]KAG5293668.1 hypothetical protein I7I52_05065 [Histoplasma capsulatum]QSS75120.1 hypothetical protein I7I50_04157 [Histoplasma capsulatum G186AR]
MSISRAFSTTRQTAMKWLGYDKDKLVSPFKEAAVNYAQNGAVKKVGEIKSIEILHRNDGTSPVHQSRYNTNDKELIISARITPLIGSAKTHHIYANGTGTMGVGDKREYSTSAMQTS